MQELDISKEILTDILEADTQFAEALRKKFQADASIRALRPNVAGLVGCELRHHLLFTYLLEPNKEWTNEEKYYACLGLANEYFFKRFDSVIVKTALKDKLGEAKMAILEPFFLKAGKPEEYIPTTIARSSNQYLALRYNTPEWVLKIWEHFGYGVTYKILRKNIRPLISTLRVRSALIKEDDLLKNPDFKKTSVNGILSYVGKMPLRRLDEVKQGKIFVEKPALKATLDKFKVSEPSEAFLFSGNEDDSIIREFIETYGATIGLNIGVYDVSKRVEITKLIKSLDLRNVNFFSGDPLAIDAAISRPQDLVVVSPNSSNFDLIREYPDYILHFKKEGMDELFAKEKAMLEGCSKFVAENGTLLYVIFTISRKEGHQTIADFLQVHPEFKFVNEVQMFPFEDLDTAMYYAVLHKESEVAKASAPLADLEAVKTSSSSVSLSEK